MKTSVLRPVSLAAVLLAASTFAHATCNSACLVGFSIAPGSIYGDTSDYGSATVQVNVPNPQLNPNVSVWLGSFGGGTESICVGGTKFSGNPGGCNWPVTQAGVNNFQFEFNGYNYYGVILNYTPSATLDVTLNSSYSVTPVSSPYEPPTQDPDAAGPCPDCAGQGGKPINFANGNTWIPQQDYSIPGLGGGLSLTRTWNSLWSLAQPVEQSGIFGDSWRSNFEARIQVLTGGIVKYWKGDGGVLSYQYNSLSGAYTMTAPTDDQTTLSYNSSVAQWTIAEKNGTQRVFNSAGYLTSIVDRNGNTTTIVVDSNNQNRIASVTDAANRTITFNYTNANPRLCTSIADSAGTIASYVYDSSGRLTQVAYADGSQFNFTYDSNNLVLKVTDSQGKVIESHTYDSQRRGMTSQQANDANGHPVNKVSVTYPTASPWTTSVCDSLGDPCVSLTITNRGQRHYLASVSGNAVCSTCGFKGGDNFGRSSAGYQIAYTDANNHSISYFYDSQGNVTSKVLPDQNQGDTWSYTYNSLGEVLTATDPLGHMTTNQYDAHGNLFSTTTPSPDGVLPGSTTSFTYDAQGDLLTITDPLNNVTTLTYYSTGLVHTIADAKNNVTTYAYDSRGNRTSVIDAAQNQTQFQYDSMNRLTKITYTDQSTVQFSYDYRGRRTSVTDQNNKVTQYAYDDADRLTSVTDAANHVTRYAYDTESRLTDIYDANNNHTQFLWNSTGRLYQTTFPSGYYESYTWDGTKQYLTSKTDRIGNAVYYSYDPQNRLYQWAGNYTNTYDVAGRLTKVADSSTSSSWTFTYDNMNRLTQVVSKYGFLSSRNTFTVKYGYDAASNRTSLTDPESGLNQYTYDTLNRLTNLQDFQSNNYGFSYDNVSRRTQLTRPNGINTNYTYDNLSRLLSVLHQAGSTTLDGASYTYDAAGNRSSRTDQRLNVTTNYTYDAIYQLLQATQGTTTTESYSYDAVGNRLSSLGMSPYQYNSSNELTSTPTTTYTYDKDGELTTKVDATGTTTYNWNTLNQLTSVVLPGSGGTVSFKYDPFGRRVQKTTASATTNYLYDGDDLIEELDNSGNILARYAQGSGLDQPISMLRAGNTAYYQQDGIATVTSMSNSSATLVNTYTVDSFGKLTNSNGSLFNPFQFTAREFDPEIGTYYYRARYYDQSVGRFLSEDFLRFRVGTDFYAYVRNQPTDFTDPSGMFPTWWHRSNTDQIARKVFGPKCADKAQAVANANAAVDATPTIGSKIAFLFGQGSGWQYGGPHFPVSATDYIIPLENSVKTCDLNGLGRALHTLQDDYAHWDPGPLGPVLHYISGPAMDYGAVINHEWRSGPALDNTEYWLQQFKDACLKCCQ